ncbi:MAG: DUF6702 family protein [Reichenbachiella sp.]|uniref:DUF6702 family protein n=1 Tax=Reichenbachiella sp. TaxID=2184521 RepID=UPI0032679C18
MSGIAPHAFHVAVSEIEFDEDKRQLEITHRIFLDDLEQGLSAWSGQAIDILNPADPANLDMLIGKYLSEKTSYHINGKLATANYLGSEKEDAVMYCYQVIKGVKKVKSINVSNKVLMEIFEDQSNVMHITNASETKSLKLNESEPNGQVNFQ